MSHILNIAFVFLHTVAFSWVCVVSASAQLSGAVDLGGGTSEASSGSSEQNMKSAKQILVTGIGATPESAEKQAITDAVRQAVGIYVDTNTIVENEAVIKDRILSVSNGFVKEYKVVSPAKQRDDGLYELQILATVQTGQVVQALKENNLISGEVAGANMWAEASTKVMNAQDAVAMLQAKMPELIKSSVTITPLGEDGKPMLSKDGTPNTAPASVKEDAATGKATLIWYLEMGFDKKYYTETLYPLVKKCMDAVSGVPSQEVIISREPSKMAELYFYFADDGAERLQQRGEGIKTGQIRIGDQLGMGVKMPALLVGGVSKNFDALKFTTYPNPRALVALRSDNNQGSGNWASLRVEMLDGEGELVAFKEIDAWQPFQGGSFILAVGAGLQCHGSPSGGTTFSFYDPIVVAPQIELDVELLRHIRNVKVSLSVPSLVVSLEKAISP